MSEAPGGEPIGRRALAAARSFQLAGPLRSIERFGSGHIHDTFALRCETESGPARYVLQRINAHVFHAPERVITNAVRVSEHLRDRLAARGAPDAARRALSWCETRGGGFAFRDAQGDFWRACGLIERTHTCDVVESPAQAAAAGHAFGAFLAHVGDLDPASLAEVLPGYGDLDGYARGLEAARAADRAGRVRDCADELAAARAAWEALAPARAARAALPRRVIHGDCKINNVLLDDQSGEGLCVIDLDTVMAASPADDFGRLVRSATCTAAEDERNLARVSFDHAHFEALTQGFLEGCGRLLTPPELEALPLAGPLCALEHVLRFLADHLAGDIYFRVHRAGQNLDRARAQRRLLEEMGAAADAAARIVRAAGS